MKGHTLTTITEKLSLLPNTLHLSKPEKITLIARETYNKVDYILTVDKKIHYSIDIYLMNILAWALYSGLEIEN